MVFYKYKFLCICDVQEIKFFDEDNSISIDDKYSEETLDFFPDIKEIGSNMNIKNDVYYRTERLKYKISLNPIEVSIKLLERYDEPPVEYRVKDSVVLESEILKKGKNHFSEDLIKNLKQEVEWNKLNLSVNAPLIFYILSKHPEIISNEEYRKFLRQTDERVKSGLLKVEEFLKENKELGLQIFEGNYGKYIWYPEERKFSDEEQKKALDYIENTVHKLLFELNPEKYLNISKDEFENSAELLKYTNLFLNKKDKTPIKNTDLEPPIKKKGNKIKWIIVIVLSIIALSCGIWTSIGVFIFGSIVISILSIR